MAEATQSQAQLKILVFFFVLFHFVLFLKRQLEDLWSLSREPALAGLDPRGSGLGRPRGLGIPPAAGFCPLCPGVRPCLLAGWLSLSPELGFTGLSLLVCSLPPPLP